MNFQIHCIWILLTMSWAIIQGAFYEFLFDDDEIFSACPGLPGSNGIHDVLDMSNINIEYHEGRVHINGNSTYVWSDVRPTDRIEVCVFFFRIRRKYWKIILPFAFFLQITLDILKYRRGAWQPTIFTLHLFDFCREQYNVHSRWYKVWSSNILEHDRKCINNYGVDLKSCSMAVFNFVISNMEGRHRHVLNIYAYDAFNVRRPKSYCFEIKGEYVKVK